MDVTKILAQLEVRKNADESFSQTGKPDFTPEHGDIRDISQKPSASRPRTQASRNNSYS